MLKNIENNSLDFYETIKNNPLILYRTIIMTLNDIEVLLNVHSDEKCFKLFRVLSEEGSLVVCYKINSQDLAETCDYIRSILSNDHFIRTNSNLTNKDIMSYMCEDYEYLFECKVNENSVLYLDDDPLYSLIEESLRLVYGLDAKVLEIIYYNDKVRILLKD